MDLDFQALVAGEKVSTTVAIKLEHTDMVQGIVEQEIEEVHYKADPANLLDTIVIDFDGYPADVRDIHVKDLPIPEGKQVHFITPEDAVVVHSVSTQPLQRKTKRLKMLRLKRNKNPLHENAPERDCSGVFLYIYI